MYYKPKKIIKIVLPIFEKIEMFNFLLFELPLILNVSLKGKQTEWRYLQGDLDIEFERHWSVGLCAPLGDGQTEKLNFFLVSGIFPGKIDSVMLLGFECTINRKNVLKSFYPFLRKSKCLIFSYVNYP